MKRLRLGVLGLGEGRSVISAGLLSPLWEVACLCDLDEQLRRQRCQEFGLQRHTASYAEMLADPGIDVIGIYTPDHLHAEHTIQALRAGKHVICTKPFLDGLARAAEVLEVWRQSGRQVLIGQSARWFAPMARQRRHYEEGKFGELATVEAYYHADHRWFLDKDWAKQQAFKWLFGGLSHPVDLVRWYLPALSEVVGVATLSANGRKASLAHPDTFHFAFKGPGGVTARVSGAYSGPIVPTERDSGMSCILRCSEGASQADYHELRYAWRIGEQAVLESFQHEEDHYFRFEGRSHHAGEYQNYLEYFAECLEQGRAPKPDVPEGIGTVALLEAMDEAARTGAAVKVRDVLARHKLASLWPA